MAGIHCPGCKAHISVPGLIDCPLCQTFLDPPFLREAKTTPSLLEVRPMVTGTPATHVPLGASRPAISAKYMMTGNDRFAVITLSIIAVLVMLIIYRVVVPSESQLYDREVSAALVTCQQRIQSLADYGDAAMPPYVKNYGKGDEFYFAWQRGSFHFKNGFGASVPMSASCIGSVSTGEIQQLTVNGKIIT